MVSLVKNTASNRNRKIEIERLCQKLLTSDETHSV